MATFDVAKLLNKITQDIPGINTVLKALANWDVSALSDVPDGAMQATTDINNRLTIKKKVSGSYTPVAKLMHDVDTVDGYHASTSATANTVAVRNSSGALPGNVLGNAATANTAVALATGTVVPVNQGGTGATTASQARANLGVADGADFTTHIAKQASPSVEGHVKLDALAADGSNTAAPGGFGLGVFAPITTDLNTIVGTRFFRGDGTTANRPIDLSLYGIHIQYSTTSAIQEAWTHETPPRKYTRRFHLGVWGDWSPSPNSITDSTATTSSTVAASATAVKAVNDAALAARTDASTALARTAPATTTSRGIGRVATLDDMKSGAGVTNAPAFLDVKGGVITRTPTANAVPQADASGKLDGWITTGNTSKPGLLQLTSAPSAVEEKMSITPKGAYDSVKLVPNMLDWGAAVTLPMMTVSGVNPPVAGLLVGRAGRPGVMEVRCNGVVIAIDSGDASNSQFQLFVKKTDLISVSNATDIIQDAHVIPFM